VLVQKIIEAYEKDDKKPTPPGTKTSSAASASQRTYKRKANET